MCDSRHPGPASLESAVQDLNAPPDPWRQVGPQVLGFLDGVHAQVQECLPEGPPVNRRGGQSLALCELEDHAVLLELVSEPEYHPPQLLGDLRWRAHS